jgi:arsenical-resistance protein 2
MCEGLILRYIIGFFQKLIAMLFTDHVQGGTIKGSLNFPAHSFYLTVPTVYAVLSAAGIKDVVFYCGESKL